MNLKRAALAGFLVFSLSSGVGYIAKKGYLASTIPDVLIAKIEDRLLDYVSSKLGLSEFHSLQTVSNSDVGFSIRLNVKDEEELRAKLYLANQIEGLSLRKIDFSRRPEGAFELGLSFTF